MFRSIVTVCGALLLDLLLSGDLLAQVTDLYRLPGGTLEGNAGYQLSTLRRQDIGTGYTAASINRQSLSRASIATPGIGGYTMQTRVGGINTNIAGGGNVSRPAASFGPGISAPASKPFSGVSTRPTVSPYLNLFREDLDGASDFNYQTLVQPELRQQEINQNLQRQQQEISGRVQQLVAQPAFNPQGSQTQFPTGHQTLFRNHSHFYPALAQPRRGKR